MRLISILTCVALMAPGLAVAQNVNFGDDSGEWSNDGECDDRRFYGSTGMASGLDRDDVGRDATDCKRGYDLGVLKVWDFQAAKAATTCSAINFGDDSGDWPNDGQCDDYRFEGPGADHVQLTEDIGKDKTDCARLCEFGEVALRNY